MREKEREDNERDENELTDAEVLAMWEEGEPVELGQAEERVEIDVSPWVVVLNTEGTPTALRSYVTNLSYFGVTSPFYSHEDWGTRDAVTAGRSE